MGKKLTLKFVSFRDSFLIQNYERQLKEKKVQYIILADNGYPKLLEQTRKAPFVLYIKGKFDFNSAENSKTIEIVGTRMTTLEIKNLINSRSGICHLI